MSGCRKDNIFKTVYETILFGTDAYYCERVWKRGIDGELLSELGIALDEINNGSIFCSCRLDKFENVLQQVLQEKPDVIIVEASGLSDPTNVKKILNQREKFPGLEYMG